MSGGSAELGRRVCLALADEGIEHGWAMVKLLAPGADLGRVWSLSRPLTYRAIASLVEADLVERSGPVAGRGPDRHTVRVTAAGSAANSEWLDRPVEHVRDLRTELLLKLVLRARRGWGTEALVAAQLQAFESLWGVPSAVDDVVARWRHEQIAAAQRFLEGLLVHPAHRSR